MLTNEPTVEAVTIKEKYFTHHKGSGTHYYFSFSNSCRTGVSKREFYQAHVGDEYYIAYYESTIAGWDNTYVYKFDADTYSLTE